MRSFVMLAIVALGVAQSSNLDAAVQYDPDPNTVLLEHFNGSNSAMATKYPLAYGSGLSGLGQAADLSSGNLIYYPRQNWHDTSINWYNPVGKEGTVEMWVQRTSSGAAFLAGFQWNYTLSDTGPSAGYSAQFGTNADGRLHWTSWSSISGDPAIVPPQGYVDGNTVIPVGQWTHVAVTWSEHATKLYVNGQLDGEYGYNLYPGGLGYFYLGNYDPNATWCKPGLIDEVRLSNIARTEFTSVPEPTACLSLLSGAALLLRRKSRQRR